MRRTIHGPARACAQVFRRLANARSDERGLALIAAIGIMTVLTVSGTALTYYATSGARASAHSRGGTTAYTLAEAGINNALSVLSNAGDPRVSTLLPSRTVTLEGGTATYSGTIDASYVWTITSTGTVRNPAGGTSIKRTLHRKVSVRGINSGADGNSWSRFYQDSTASCLTIDNMTFVTNVATRGDLCLRDSGAIIECERDRRRRWKRLDPGPGCGERPRSPTAATGTSWTTPTNVFTSNNVYATYSVPTAANSNYLDVTGFGFTIPATAIIRGISVSIERKASATNSLKDDDVYIKKASCTDPCGTDHANTSTYYGTSDSTDSYGSSSDLWGKTWTAADVNSSSFGVHYRIHNFAGSAATDSSTRS